MKLIAINSHTVLDKARLSDEIKKDVPNTQVKKSVIRALTLTEKWIKNTLGKPHPKLGRKGPVCPYVPRAATEGRIYLSYCLYHSQTTVDDICDQMVHFHKSFLENNDSFLNSIVIPFISMDNNEEKGIKLVEEAQKYLKPKFIKNNAMIGQFFPKCPVEGLHSKEFRPFDCQIPCLAIRNLMPQDVVFVTDSDMHSKIYLDRFKVDSRNDLVALLKKNGVGGNRNVISHVDHIFGSRKAQ